MRNPDQSKLMELISNYATLIWQDGVQAGRRNTAIRLVEDSGLKFANGQDEQATAMRALGREIQREVEKHEQVEKPKRDKTKEELYKEIIGQLERMIEIDQSIDNSLEIENLIEEARRRRRNN